MKIFIIIFTLISCGKPQLPGSRKKRYSAQDPAHSKNVEARSPTGYNPQIVNTPSSEVEEPVVKAPSLPQPAPNPVKTKPQPTDGNYEIEVGGLYGATVYIPRANKKFPVIVWGNGCKAGSQKYRSMLKNVAKQGYIVVQSAAELSNKSVSNCEAHSNFYTPLTQLASNIKSSPHSKMDNSKIIFAGHSMGASAAIAASRNFSSTPAVVAFTPCVYYDQNFGGLPKPTLVLEAGSYTVDGRTWHRLRMAVSF